jgi:uncharacterized protein (TIGR03435 family)
MLTKAGLILAGCLAVAPLWAAGLEFEVASVKPSPEGSGHFGMSIEHGKVDIGGLPLAWILQAAFGVGEGQITGPDWMYSARFDILAKITDGSTED